MYGVSHRAEAMPASPIRKLVPYADGAKARGIEVLHLNIGQPDVNSPDEFWSAVKNSGLNVLEYSPSPGIPALREKVASYYRNIGIDVQAKNVIVTTAGSEALLFALLSCLNPGEEVVVPEPMYANYISFATAADVRVIPLTTKLDEDFRLPATVEFEKALTPKTRAILICNPGNPTGTVYSTEQMQELGALCRKHGLFLIGDEVYRDFNYTDSPITSVLQLEGMEEQAIMVDSVSKRWSLCGARIGFFVTRNEKLLDAALRLSQARLSPPTLEQLGVIGALDCPPSYYSEVREEFRRRRDTLVARITKMPGAKVPKIEGAFYATVRLPIDDSDKFCQWLLESFDHEGRTIMFAPATGFYSTPGEGRDEVRIAYVLNQERMELAMDILEAALAVYPGRTN
ncbi:MAG: pyridoxal phosphate-dependent aminotransferase [Fimbriimonadaceae bacterium]